MNQTLRILSLGMVLFFSNQGWAQTQDQYHDLQKQISRLADEVRNLNQRIVVLEKRLAAYEQNPAGSGSQNGDSTAKIMRFGWGKIVVERCELSGENLKCHLMIYPDRSGEMAISPPNCRAVDQLANELICWKAGLGSRESQPTALLNQVSCKLTRDVPIKGFLIFRDVDSRVETLVELSINASFSPIDRKYRWAIPAGVTEVQKNITVDRR